jgi:hypothetical protein
MILPKLVQDSPISTRFPASRLNTLPSRARAARTGIRAVEAVLGRACDAMSACGDERGVAPE